MTLVEVMVASAISSIIVLALLNLTYFATRSFVAMTNYIDLDQKSRNALDTMTKQIRQASALTTSTTNSLTFQDYDGGVLDYTYDAQSKMLWRTKAGVRDAKPLLEQCDLLKFAIFQRTPVGGSFEQFPTAVPATTKVVQMTWICSRTILGAKVNTEAVLSAKVVIRK